MRDGGVIKAYGKTDEALCTHRHFFIDVILKAPNGGTYRVADNHRGRERMARQQLGLTEGG